jgi:DegV family protein with EDD domain
MKSAVLEPDRLKLEVVPMRIQVGGQDYTDDETLSVPSLLEAMRQEKSASSTACPAPGAFAKAFEEAECSICFTISGSLSGTYNAAMTARDMVAESHPEKRVCVIDSKSTAGAMGLLVRRARALILGSETPEFESVCDRLREYQAALRTVFTLECYDNLIKNGRMRPLVGTLLHTLGIRIIADGTPQGSIHVAGKTKGEQKTYRGIVELMTKSKDCRDADVFISQCENLSGALKLKELILSELPVREVSITSCRGLTSYYAMEKGLIICF